MRVARTQSLGASHVEAITAKNSSLQTPSCVPIAADPRVLTTELVKITQSFLRNTILKSYISDATVTSYRVAFTGLCLKPHDTLFAPFQKSLCYTITTCTESWKLWNLTMAVLINFGILDYVKPTVLNSTFLGCLSNN